MGVDSTSATETIEGDSEQVESNKTAEEEIVDDHKIIHDAVVSLRDTVMKQLGEQGIILDPSGWKVYGFDANEVSREQVMDLSMQSETTDPAFEIDFSPVLELRTASKSYFSEENASSETSGPLRRKAERVNFSTNMGEAVDLELLPIGVRDPEWSYMKCNLAGDFGVVGMMWPEVISSTKEEEVIVNNLRRSDANDAVNIALGRVDKIAELAKRMAGGGFHYRIFSNVDRRHSDQPPSFILANERLKDSAGNPQLNSSAK